MKNNSRNFYICFLIYQVLIIFNALIGKYYVNAQRYNVILTLLFSAFFILTIFYFCLLTKKTIKDAKTTAYVNILKEQQQLKEKHNQEINKRRSETIIFQNGIKTKLSTLHTLLLNKDYTNAIMYFKKISVEFHNTNFHTHCSDNLLNAILASKRHIAEEHGICINYNISLPQQFTLISSSVSCIFFNLLDNGIEACIRSQNINPFLNITTRYKEEFLTIHMENTKKPDESFTHHTVKFDALSHGFGLSIIEEIVQDYNGSCEWIDHGNTFESTLLLHYSPFISQE